MAVTEDFYRERAAEARAAAGESDLANVAERHLRAATAWEHMADRVRRTRDARVANEERKTALAAAAEVDA